MERTYWTRVADGTELHVKLWTPGTEMPKAIIQLSHGMAEHIERYRPFAEYMADQRFLVCGHDHRGHGRTGERQGTLGHLQQGSGFETTVADLLEISENLVAAYPHLPTFLIGHSFGSFIARRALQLQSGRYTGAVLIGTGNVHYAAAMAGRFLASLLPEQQPSKMLDNIVFGKYNERIDNPLTKFDWLSRDPDEVAKYAADPLCGFIPTAGFFHELLSGLAMIGNWRQNRAISPDFPLLLISGTDDPVGSYGAGVWKTAKHYSKARLQDTAVCIIEGARHELLNEIGKEEVMRFISRWVEGRM